MNKKELLERFDLKPFRYEIKGKTIFIDTNEGRFVLKKKNPNEDSIYQYLKSRDFPYLPSFMNDSEDEYKLRRFIEEVEMPKEQKMLDYIDVLATLHLKTSHYIEVNEDEYKKLYEDIKNNLVYLNSYYEDYVSLFEQNVIMSPSEYLFCRNSTQVFLILSYAEKKLEEWFQLVKDQHQERHVVLHNDVDLSHFLRGEKPYLIHFEKAKFDMPIFDLYKLYKRYGEDYDFISLLERYEKKYPLLKEEKNLLFLLLAIPNKLDFTGSEYEKCVKITHFLEQIKKTFQLLPNDTEERKQQN